MIPIFPLISEKIETILSAYIGQQQPSKEIKNERTDESNERQMDHGDLTDDETRRILDVD
jgi:hypothetical protein